MSKPTVMMVSKAHQTNVKRLYKMIFQLHKSMPIELRDMGNAYVRNEFKLHKSANPDQTKTFMKEWGNYTKTLMKQVNPKYKTKLGVNFELEQLDDFNDGQVSQLYELFQASKETSDKN